MVSEKCDHGKLSLRTDRDVDDLEKELQLRRLHCDAPLDQGKTTLSKSCTCGMATKTESTMYQVSNQALR